MKELREILHRVDGFASSERAILATVVDVKGSGYRLAGARMLIDADGHSIGSISGGCLESDVLERAKNVLRTGKSKIVVYDSTAEDNSVFGLQMGCRGVVRILLEPANNTELFHHVRTAFTNRKTIAIATLIAANGANAENIGLRVYSGNDSSDLSVNNFPATIWPKLKQDIDRVIVERRSRTQIYAPGDEALEFFIEAIEPLVTAVIFGAGHDAIPVAAFAKQMGWNVTVIDRRPAYASPARFPDADAIIAAHVEEIDDAIFSDENAVAVVMTHHFESDRDILRRLATSHMRYVGILGPKQRTADLLKQIRDSGTMIDGAFLECLHAPIGLDIGAATPESIALSIVGEIQAVLSRRDGGYLKHRTQPIYDR